MPDCDFVLDEMGRGELDGNAAIGSAALEGVRHAFHPSDSPNQRSQRCSSHAGNVLKVTECRGSVSGGARVGLGTPFLLLRRVIRWCGWLPGGRSYAQVFTQGARRESWCVGVVSLEASNDISVMWKWQPSVSEPESGKLRCRLSLALVVLINALKNENETRALHKLWRVMKAVVFVLDHANK